MSVVCPFTSCSRGVYSDLVQSLDLSLGDDAKVGVGREGVAPADMGQSSSEVGGLDGAGAQKVLALGRLEEHCESVVLDSSNGLADMEEKVFFCHVFFYFLLVICCGIKVKKANRKGGSVGIDTVDVCEIG